MVKTHATTYGGTVISCDVLLLYPIPDTIVGRNSEIEYSGV